MLHETVPILLADIERLGSAGCSRKTIARLTDLHENILSRSIAGTRVMTLPEFKILRAIVDDLLALHEQLVGVPIDWTDVAALRKLIAESHEERSVPPQLLTPVESQCLAKFASGADIDHLAIDASMSKSEFLSHVESLLSRSARLASLAKRQVTALSERK